MINLLGIFDNIKVVKFLKRELQNKKLVKRATQDYCSWETAKLIEEKEKELFTFTHKLAEYESQMLSAVRNTARSKLNDYKHNIQRFKFLKEIEKTPKVNPEKRKKIKSHKKFGEKIKK